MKNSGMIIVTARAIEEEIRGKKKRKEKIKVIRGHRGDESWVDVIGFGV